MLDEFVHGGVSRISPEAPVPVLRIERSHSMLGGAGNAARNLSSLGCGVWFFSAAGDDPEADRIAELLAALPGARRYLARDRDRQTPVKTRYMAHGQQLLRADKETTLAVSPQTAADLLAAFRAALPECSAVLISDYAKGVLDGEAAQDFIGAARQAGKPAVVDPKGRDFIRYRGATVIKPNLKELGEATGLPVADDHAQETAARRLLADTGAEHILLTRGAAGMMLVSAGGSVVRVPALAREVYDVSGAGDTVAAVLAAGLGSGATLLDAVELANVAAGIVVGKAGTAVAEPHELIHEVRNRSAIRASDKVLQPAEAVDLARNWKKQGLVIGFTNGCFDLLHPGHLQLLETARSSCDRLLVGLNGDESVKRLKGPSRPIQGQLARALVLASLNCVDGVVIFDDDTPVELIRSLRPTCWSRAMSINRKKWLARTSWMNGAESCCWSTWCRAGALPPRRPVLPRRPTDSDSSRPDASIKNMAARLRGKREAVARISARIGVTSAIEILPQRRRFVVLNYHRIGDASQTPYDSGVFTAGAEAFDLQITHLKRSFRMATLDEITEAAGIRAPRGISVLITFDDGYLDNYRVAFPILKSHGVQGVFFLPTAFVGTGRIPWWDVIAYILKHSRNRKIQLQYPEPANYDLDRQPVPDVVNVVLGACKRNEVRADRLIADLERACDCPRPLEGTDRCFLNWDEAREMKASGMAFGSHTHTHEILAKLPETRQLEELTVSREIMERELSCPVRTLAYPVGLPSTFSASTVDLARRAGYTAAFSFYGGTNTPGQIDPFNIRRLSLDDPSMPRLRLQTALHAVTGSYWF